MAVTALRRLAATAPAPVFAAVGPDRLAAVEDLGLHPGLALAASPRHASILLVAGALRDPDRDDLRRLHDQLPHPRATVWWGTPNAEGGRALPADAGPAPVLRALHRALMTGEQESEPDLLPDEPPAPWRGQGPYGQGGEGMMGGVPYGRPMPMTDEDLRDGLALDAYTASLGPFLPFFPPGLLLELTLQGDVIQRAAVKRPPHRQHASPGPAAALRRIARLIRLLGLPALAERLLRAAGAGQPFPGLERRLRRSAALAAIPPGLGVVAREDVRDRLRLWCQEAEGRGTPATTPSPNGQLASLLPGLEWHEAVLVLNSFETHRPEMFA